MSIDGLRIGCVSFLNARPLIQGLVQGGAHRLIFDVPSALLALLQSKQVDVALLPAIDYQRLAGARIVPGGCIGCDGPTLTVRLFSRTPIEQMTTLACDPDSHSSVALATIILHHVYGLRPRFVALEDDDEPTPRLLIGDKVVCPGPSGFDYQVDLGQAWKQWTGLPFVFAVWVARPGVEVGNLPAQLEKSLQCGMAQLERIITTEARPRGWDDQLARRYMTQYLQYTLDVSADSPQLAALKLYYDLATREKLIDAPPQPLRIISST